MKKRNTIERTIDSKLFFRFDGNKVMVPLSLQFFFFPDSEKIELEVGKKCVSLHPSFGGKKNKKCEKINASHIILVLTLILSFLLV